MRQTPGTAAFSLVELVIVVSVVGLLAAIAVPRVSRGARGAAESALRADLAALRAAIDLYTEEHGGALPGGTHAGGGFGNAGSEKAFRNQLLLYTDHSGKCSKTKTSMYQYGPYLRKGIPALPVGKNRGSVGVTMSKTSPPVTAKDKTGWVYCYLTGEIIPNADEIEFSGVRTYASY